MKLLSIPEETFSNAVEAMVKLYPKTVAISNQQASILINAYVNAGLNHLIPDFSFKLSQITINDITAKVKQDADSNGLNWSIGSIQVFLTIMETATASSLVSPVLMYPNKYQSAYEEQQKTGFQGTTFSDALGKGVEDVSNYIGNIIGKVGDGISKGFLGVSFKTVLIIVAVIAGLVLLIYFSSYKSVFTKFTGKG